MIRRLALGVAALAALSSLTACDTADPVAIRTNGNVLRQSDFDDVLQVYLDDENAAAEIAGQAKGTVNGEVVRNLLRREALFSLVADEVKARKLPITDSIKQQAEAQLDTIAEPTSSGTATGIFAKLPKAYQERLRDQVHSLIALQDDFAGLTGITDDQLKAKYDADPSNYEQLCVSWIVADTEDDAKAAVADVQGGQPFADVAKARSVDGTKDAGGELRKGDGSCTTRTELANGLQTIPEVAQALQAAKVGETSAPIPSANQWFVVLVTDIAAFDPAAFRASLASESVAQLQTWYQEAMAKADISVNPRYGVWSSDALAITAPGPVAALDPSLDPFGATGG